MTIDGVRRRQPARPTALGGQCDGGLGERLRRGEFLPGRWRRRTARCCGRQVLLLRRRWRDFPPSPAPCANSVLAKSLACLRASPSARSWMRISRILAFASSGVLASWKFRRAILPVTRVHDLRVEIRLGPFGLGLREIIRRLQTRRNSPARGRAGGRRRGNSCKTARRRRRDATTCADNLTRRRKPPARKPPDVRAGKTPSASCGVMSEPAKPSSLDQLLDGEVLAEKFSKSVTPKPSGASTCLTNCPPTTAGRCGRASAASVRRRHHHILANMDAERGGLPVQQQADVSFALDVVVGEILRLVSAIRRNGASKKCKIAFRAAR